MDYNYIPVINRSRSTKVPTDSIVLLKNDKKRLTINTEDNEEYSMYGGLENVEDYLDTRFYPCIKGTYLNLAKIVDMDVRYHEITFENGYKFYLGRDSFTRTRQRYNAYIRGLIPIKKLSKN
ncbi:MAG: LytTR family transcriptional regulator DNA-binding domain-containing protein [Eubacteriales bacterium]|nr:LytTR family transcriptional regulator DNA-binding domain-containing protein [Eubacteriales bacterium]